MLLLKKYVIFTIFLFSTQILHAENKGVLNYAAEGNLEKLAELLNEGAHPGTMDEQGFTLIHTFAATGDIEMVSFLAASGADIYAKTDDGLNALHIAVIHEQTNMIQFLLDTGSFDISGKDITRGLSPLQWAAEKGRLRSALVLLENGADINDVDKYGWTALHHASFLWRLESVNLLKDKGADISITNNNGDTAANLANLTQFIYNKGDASGNLLEPKKPVVKKVSETKTSADDEQTAEEEETKEETKTLANDEQTAEEETKEENAAENRGESTPPPLAFSAGTKPAVWDGVWIEKPSLLTFTTKPATWDSGVWVKEKSF